MEKEKVNVSYVKEVTMGDLGASKKGPNGTIVSLPKSMSDADSKIYQKAIRKFTESIVAAKDAAEVDEIISNYAEKNASVIEKIPAIADIPNRFSTYQFKTKNETYAFVEKEDIMGDLTPKGTATDLIMSTNFLEKIAESKELNKTYCVGKDGKAESNKVGNYVIYEKPYKLNEIIALAVLRDISKEMALERGNMNSEVSKKFKPMNVFNKVRFDDESTKELVKNKLEKLANLLPENSQKTEFNYNTIARNGMFSFNPETILTKNQLNKLSTVKEMIKSTPSAIRFTPVSLIKFSGKDGSIDMVSKLKEALKESVDNKIAYRQKQIDGVEPAKKDVAILEKEIAELKDTLKIGNETLDVVKAGGDNINTRETYEKVYKKYHPDTNQTEESVAEEAVAEKVHEEVVAEEIHEEVVAEQVHEEVVEEKPKAKAKGKKATAMK